MRGFLVAGLAALGACLAAPAAEAAGSERPNVVATIAPIHSLVAQVMDGLGTPALLMRGADTPHGFALRPSEARGLAAADLVVWVGPTLESGLAKAMATLPRAEARLTLIEAPGVRPLPVRTGAEWDAHDHGKGHAHGSAHKHGHGKAEGAGSGHDEWDGHLWLDPSNAAAILHAVAERLATLDPPRAADYRRNAAAAAARVEALDQELARRLAPVSGRPYLVFHDAYQYLERRYGLSPVGAITLSAERKPGAKRLRALRKRVADTGARCVFSEPQFAPGLAETVIEGSRARIAVLDPIGAAVPPGPGHYGRMLTELAGALAGCLAPNV